MVALLLVLRRLVGPTGSPDVARQLMRLRLSAVWVTMVAFEGQVQVPGGMEGRGVRGRRVGMYDGPSATGRQGHVPVPGGVDGKGAEGRGYLNLAKCGSRGPRIVSMV